MAAVQSFCDFSWTSRIKLNKSEWTIECFAGKISNLHRNTLWLTQSTSVCWMIFVRARSRTFHICFIMIGLWEGFNLLHGIIIRYPNGYVLCLNACVCVVVHVDWIKDRKPIINEYNHNNNNIAMHTKKSQWLNDKLTSRNYWLHDGIHTHTHTAGKFYERIKRTLKRATSRFKVFDMTSQAASEHQTLALTVPVFLSVCFGDAIYDFIKAVSLRGTQFSCYALVHIQNTLNIISFVCQPAHPAGLHSSLLFFTFSFRTVNAASLKNPDHRIFQEENAAKEFSQAIKIFSHSCSGLKNLYYLRLYICVAAGNVSENIVRCV